MNLSGRHALITGGGSGLGADLARCFAEAGARVSIAGRNREKLQAVAARHTDVVALTADVTDEASVKNLFKAAGRCDIVIANAGAAESAPFARTTMAQWNDMLAVNLTGTFLTLREGLNQMTGWGRLIAVSSIAGLRGYAYVAPYAAAKHGVVGLVRSIALEVAKRPITANVLCPGYLDTEMTVRSVENIVAKTGISPESARATLAAMNPHNRLIEPAEVSAIALKLCGEGSDGVNGQAIPVPDIAP
jgi:NAD(P)-dependent dehydrogenase (short-subunit alcohol dehydrogenase family)